MTRKGTGVLTGGLGVSGERFLTEVTARVRNVELFRTTLVRISGPTTETFINRGDSFMRLSTSRTIPLLSFVWLDVCNGRIGRRGNIHEV